eukprot:12410617-Karenia_brevis.AAC.2
MAHHMFKSACRWKKWTVSAVLRNQRSLLSVSTPAVQSPLQSPPVPKKRLLQAVPIKSHPCEACSTQLYNTMFDATRFTCKLADNPTYAVRE